MWKAVAVTASYIPLTAHFESVQSLKVFERRYRDMFVRCHENYLVNPEYVSRISRYRIELTYGKVIPISEKNYTAVKTKLSHIT